MLSMGAKLYNVLKEEIKREELLKEQLKEEIKREEKLKTKQLKEQLKQEELLKQKLKEEIKREEQLKEEIKREEKLKTKQLKEQQKQEQILREKIREQLKEEEEKLKTKELQSALARVRQRKNQIEPKIVITEEEVVKKPTNEWSDFVKQYSIDNNITFKEALTQAKEAYKNRYNDNSDSDKTDDTIESCKTNKKKSISATVKRLVWNKNIGEAIGKSKCLCCETTDITQMSFHCGHIIAEIKGGETIVSNLKPICQNCNSSMGSKNMNEFKATLN